MSSINIQVGPGAYAADPSADYNIALGAGAYAVGGRKGCYAHGPGCCVIGNGVSTLTHEQARNLVKGNRAAEAYMRSTNASGSAGMISMGSMGGGSPGMVSVKSVGGVACVNGRSTGRKSNGSTIHVSGGNGAKVHVSSGKGSSCFVSTGDNATMYVNSHVYKGGQRSAPHAHGRGSVAARNISGARFVGGVHNGYAPHQCVGGVYNGVPADPPTGTGVTIIHVDPSDPDPPKGDFVADSIIYE